MARMIERRRDTNGRWIGQNAYLLAPGWVMTSCQPLRLHAVLGVSVAVCIRDKARNNGGMCQYFRARSPSPKQATPRYGDAALSALLRSLVADGSEQTDLEAWIFGGAVPENAGSEMHRLVADAIAVAREFLRRRGVAIVSEDVGGVVGRKIAFDLGSGQALVLKTRVLRKRDWLPVIPA